MKTSPQMKALVAGVSLIALTACSNPNMHHTNRYAFGAHESLTQEDLADAKFVPINIREALENTPEYALRHKTDPIKAEVLRTTEAMQIFNENNPMLVPKPLITKVYGDYTLENLSNAVKNPDSVVSKAAVEAGYPYENGKNPTLNQMSEFLERMINDAKNSLGYRNIEKSTVSEVASLLESYSTNYKTTETHKVQTSDTSQNYEIKISATEKDAALKEQIERAKVQIALFNAKDESLKNIEESHDALFDQANDGAGKIREATSAIKDVNRRVALVIKQINNDIYTRAPWGDQVFGTFKLGVEKDNDGTITSKVIGGVTGFVGALAEFIVGGTMNVADNIKNTREYTPTLQGQGRFGFFNVNPDIFSTVEEDGRTYINNISLEDAYLRSVNTGRNVLNAKVGSANKVIAKSADIIDKELEDREIRNAKTKLFDVLKDRVATATTHGQIEKYDTVLNAIIEANSMDTIKALQKRFGIEPTLPTPIVGTPVSKNDTEQPKPETKTKTMLAGIPLDSNQAIADVVHHLHEGGGAVSEKLEKKSQNFASKFEKGSITPDIISKQKEEFAKSNPRHV